MLRLFVFLIALSSNLYGMNDEKSNSESVVVKEQPIDYNQVLLFGAKNGNAVLIKEALANKAPVDLREASGHKTAALIASENGHLEALKALWEARADINAVSSTQETALHWAAYNGHGQVVEFLLAAKADKNAKDQDGLTPLHNAAYKNRASNSEIIKILLNAGVDKNSKSDSEETPLHKAIRNNCLNNVKALLEGCVDKESRNKQGFTPLHAAVFKSSGELVDLILLAKADAEAILVGDTMLNFITKADNAHYIGALPMLLEHGAHIARPFVKQQEIQAIIGQLNLNDVNYCLITAALLDNHKYFKQLVKNRLPQEELNKQDNTGMTALMWATARGNVNIVKTLLEYGKKNNYCVDSLLKDKKDRTASDLAYKHKRKKILALLYNYLEPKRKELENIILDSLPVSTHVDDSMSRLSGSVSNIIDYLWGAKTIA